MQRDIRITGNFLENNRFRPLNGLTKSMSRNSVLRLRGGSKNDYRTH
jgi:hypothetical protein